MAEERAGVAMPSGPTHCDPLEREQVKKTYSSILPFFLHLPVIFIEKLMDRPRYSRSASFMGAPALRETGGRAHSAEATRGVFGVP